MKNKTFSSTLPRLHKATKTVNNTQLTPLCTVFFVLFPKMALAEDQYKKK
jgi:hypothetical protein